MLSYKQSVCSFYVTITHKICLLIVTIQAGVI